MDGERPGIVREKHTPKKKRQGREEHNGEKVKLRIAP